ncbi:hypothetical protein Salat_1063500 [Sesamum alatum]|uniref:Uncharacterized protein n=1 Tax=Sesamum alatum TaxID=300844 RepID=A0AAE1YNH7_9LAMI|nr:hypothetical protein Salat_1063500 [Sesamum alatum]
MSRGKYDGGREGRWGKRRGGYIGGRDNGALNFRDGWTGTGMRIVGMRETGWCVCRRWSGGWGESSMVVAKHNAGAGEIWKGETMPGFGRGKADDWWPATMHHMGYPLPDQ